MSGRFSGKVALVREIANCIGKVIAMCLANEGAMVVPRVRRMHWN
ncbi:hypothetical protein [Belnapia arida]|nr:hypothetical protein [Belnapia arida]